eukprot:s2314_g9.t1
MLALRKSSPGPFGSADLGCVDRQHPVCGAFDVMDERNKLGKRCPFFTLELQALHLKAALRKDDCAEQVNRGKPPDAA